MGLYDIPIIVEKLYDSMVNIPDPKDWPDYIGGNRLVGDRLYSFYAGLQLGMQLSEACRPEELPPPQCDNCNFGPVEQPEGGTGIA